ncbi:hypothetical protein AVEN_208312-1 [Araneus ventricosus]|uniref:Secreted protein n=1 Tax=Araneus ventricosus TaxID=182803 RepID=A0A4Y2T2H0_ARAVE|nr:hypothetical protein AVEN_208312-1 [Araneus ventricosus]
MQQVPMLLAFLLFRQKIVALLLPPFTSSLPQLFAVKHNATPQAFRWSALGGAIPQLLAVKHNATLQALRWSALGVALP